jgi:uncharacterized protein (TIGR03118 family)
MRNWLSHLYLFGRSVSLGSAVKHRGRARGPSRPVLEPLEDRRLLAGGFLQTNLVSDVAGLAATTDANLINPWGVSASPGGPLWVADNGTGLSTVYNGQGQPTPPIVTIPPASASAAHGSPTGVVFNTNGTGFNVSSGGKTGSSLFLFDSLDGTISGWSPSVDTTHAFVMVNNPGAVYTGLAIGTGSNGQTLLYAANHSQGTIDVYDQNFHKVTTLAGSFQDPNLPANTAPFNVQNINGLLYVEYSAIDPATHRTAAGAGTGVVDVFTTGGVLQKRLITGGALNAPWGVALAPARFGPFSNDLLVGNFGDGHINAFDASTGQFVGQLTTSNGQPFSEDHLWALQFGSGGSAGNANTLYFVAGINNEKDGLLGTLNFTSPAPAAHPGIFDPTTATWFLRNENSAGAPDGGQFQYGAPGWVSVVGDWTGSGHAGIGVFDPTTATWFLRNETSSGAPDAGRFQFGAPGWLPIVGDWTGTGHAGIGVVDPATGTFYLRTELSAGAPDAGRFQYGAPGWKPVAGDWTGTGHAGIGVFDPSTATFFLRNETSAGAPDAGQFQYGAPGWVPLAGDWTGSGHAGVGAFDPTLATWFLRNENSAGAPDAGQFQFGAAGWQPVNGNLSPATSQPASSGTPSDPGSMPPPPPPPHYP